MTTPTAGSVFGLVSYGEALYGIGLPPEYLVTPMTAASNSYTSVLVTWNAPSGIIFRYRLLRNRYGYPVNENDGDILYDTEAYPGNSFTDLDVSPGTYHYYGFYVLVDIADNIWIRGGFAGCLAIQDFGSGDWLFSSLPEYFTTIPSTGDALTDYAPGDSALQAYLNVIGWMLDYLRTQYASYANHLNDATFIPLDDLWNLAGEVGLTFSPDVPAYTVRKATENFAHVAQQRGTLGGIAEEIALRTGYGADVHLGPNILLDDDQSEILSPVFVQYDSAREYHKDECVWVPFHGYVWNWTGDGYAYRCLTEGQIGGIPTGNASNSNWAVLYYTSDFLATQVNFRTNGVGTWEVLDPAASSDLALPGACWQTLGAIPPATITTNGQSQTWNTLRITNKQGSAKTLWCRSIARRHFDIAEMPDPGFEAGFTVAPANPDSNETWVPGGWPSLTLANWMGGSEPVNVLPYWTTFACQLNRQDAVSHTGSWALEILPAVSFSGASGGIQIVQAFTITDGYSGSFPKATTAGNTLIAVIGNYAETYGDVPSVTGVTLGGSAGNWAAVSGATAVSGWDTVNGAYQIVSVWADVDCAAGTAIAVTGTNLTTAAPADGIGILVLEVSGLAASTPLDQAAEATELTGETWAATTSSTTQAYELAVGGIMNAVDHAVLTSAGWHTFDTDGDLFAAYQILSTEQAVSFAGTQHSSGAWAAAVATFKGSVTSAPDLPPVILNSPWLICTASGSASCSAYYYAATAGSSATAALVYYDQNGVQISVTSGTTETGTATTWVNITASGTAPAGTAYVAVQVTITDPVPVAYLDDVTVTPGNTPAVPPDQVQAVQDGIPVPWTLDSQQWNPAVRYVTNDIVQYDGQPFQALRASTGSIPPPNDIATTDWAPLSQSPRIRVCVSGYTSQDLSSESDYAYAVTPFVEWYDQQGNYITRIFARSAAGNGSVSRPGNMAYDSFTTESIIASAGSSAYNMTLTNWAASFYDNITISGTPCLTRIDSVVDFTWSGDSPGFGVASSGWSASWVTDFTAPVGGSYAFQLQAGNGGSRMIVNGITVIDNWAAQSGTNLTADVTLTAGQAVAVEIDYYNPLLEDIVYGDDLFAAPGPVTVFNEFSEVQVSYWEQTEIVSYSCEPFRIRPHDRLQLNDWFFTGNCDLYLTVSWLDIHGTVIATGQQFYAAGSYESISEEFIAPSGCWQGFVTFAPDERSGFYRQHDQPSFQCVIGGRGQHGGPTCICPVIIAEDNQDFIVHGAVTVPAVSPEAATYSNTLAGRATDDEQSNWISPISSTWTVGGYAGGSVWPANPESQAIGLITTQPANTTLGVTFRSMPLTGFYSGLVFRYTNTLNYWRADQAQLGYVHNGTYNLIAAHTTAFLPGDRMTVVLNGTAITVYRNGAEVNSATSSFNESYSDHGIINDTAYAQGGASDPDRKDALIRPRSTPSTHRRGSGSKTGRHQ